MKITPALEVTVFAGDATPGRADGPRLSARFDQIIGLAMDRDHDLYVADANNSTIRKIAPDGSVITYAGVPGVTGSADGAHEVARFNLPSGVATDPLGNLYVTDGSHTIRKITPDQRVTTLAGTASLYGSADGTGRAARFRGPLGVAVDRADNIYVAEQINCTVRKLTLDGVTTTLAGTAASDTMSNSIDGTGPGARFRDPTDVTVDAAGNVFVAEGSTVRIVTAGGVVTTFAGVDGLTGDADGPRGAARFRGPIGLAVDAADRVYVADVFNYTIRLVTTDGVSTYAGAARNLGHADGDATEEARFASPDDVAVDRAGNVYVADALTDLIRKITPDHRVITLAGTAGQRGDADGLGPDARFNGLTGLAVDPTGNVYVVDQGNATIRKITPDGVVTTVAGTTGTTGILLGDAPASLSPGASPWSAIHSSLPISTRCSCSVTERASRAASRELHGRCSAGSGSRPTLPRPRGGKPAALGLSSAAPRAPRSTDLALARTASRKPHAPVSWPVQVRRLDHDGVVAAPGIVQQTRVLPARSVHVPPLGGRMVTSTGSVIGTYRVLGEIGTGGMGAVYLGEHTLLGRRAAIKLLLPSLSLDQDIINRFFNEARAVTMIVDPGIVQIFDFGYHVDGSAFIVMELLEGEPMSQRLARIGRFALADCLRFMRLICSSLGAVHAKGIVHRDLKPENIFLVRDPAVLGGERSKILDFGIAKLSVEEPGARKTRTGMLMGTPVYMSPEQCRGAGDIDHRSDIYTMGCVMFTMLAGRPPFEGDASGELIASHLREIPPWASAYVEGLPEIVDQILQRCMAKSPLQRFQSMAELDDALRLAEDAARPDLEASGHPPPRRLERQSSPPTLPTTLSGASGTTAATPPPGAGHRRRAGVIAAVALVAGVALVALRGASSPDAPTAASVVEGDAGRIEAPAPEPPVPDAAVREPIREVRAAVDAGVADAAPARPRPAGIVKPIARDAGKGGSHDSSTTDLDRGD